MKAGLLFNMLCSCLMPFSLISAEQFFEDFSQDRLDSNKWLVAEKAWGVENGGVVSDNVSIKFNSQLGKNTLRLRGHGDLYNGAVKGVDKQGNRIEKTNRVGAAIATRDYFASGIYEVRMKLPVNLGACSALWTFHYEEAYEGTQLYSDLSRVGGVKIDDFQFAGLSDPEANQLWKDLISYKPNGREPYIVPTGEESGVISSYFRAKVWDSSRLDLTEDFGKKESIYIVLLNSMGLINQGSEYMGYYKVRNHEIDIELPTALKEFPMDISYRNARFNTWIGESGGEYTDEFVDLGQHLNDGLFHTYKIVWVTDDHRFQNRRVEFYVDNNLVQVNYTHIPDIAGRFWIGLWFPTWAGNPDFNIDQLEVDWVKITPFNSEFDRYDVEESYPDFGWAEYNPSDSSESDITDEGSSVTDDNPDLPSGEETDGTEGSIAENLSVEYSVTGNSVSVNASSIHGLKRINFSGKYETVTDQWLDGSSFSQEFNLNPGLYTLDITDYSGGVFHEEIEVLSMNNDTVEDQKDFDVVYSTTENRLKIDAFSKFGLKRVNVSGPNGTVTDLWLDGREYSQEFEVVSGVYHIDVTDYNGNIFHEAISFLML